MFKYKKKKKEMQVNLPSFQKNDFILSLMVYNYYKKGICLAISHYVLLRQLKLSNKII